MKLAQLVHGKQGLSAGQPVCLATRHADGRPRPAVLLQTYGHLFACRFSSRPQSASCDPPPCRSKIRNLSPAQHHHAGRPNLNLPGLRQVQTSTGVVFCSHCLSPAVCLVLQCQQRFSRHGHATAAVLRYGQGHWDTLELGSVAVMLLLHASM